MLKSKEIAFINHFEDSTRIFGSNVSIAGGVNYFLKDNKYNSNICNFNELDTILNKNDIFVVSKFYGNV